MASPLVLFVEDDAALRRSVVLMLADDGFEVLEAANGQQGLRQLDRLPDGVLLDLGLPDIDGFELCRRVRDRTTGPVLILSADGEPDAVARALAAGADDYLVKPFPTVDLARRLRALLPALPSALAQDVAPDEPPAELFQHAPTLSVTESRLLVELSAEPGSAVEREALLRRVWGVPPAAGPAVLVARLQSLCAKLEAAGGPSITSSGTGYRLQA